MSKNKNLRPSAVTVNGNPGNDSYVGTTDADSYFLQQGGDDTVFGDAGNDGFYFGAAFDARDVVDGGADTDTLVLQGNYAGGTTLAGVTNSEVVLLASGADTRFGDNANNRYSYTLATVDANV